MSITFLLVDFFGPECFKLMNLIRKIIIFQKNKNNLKTHQKCTKSAKSSDFLKIRLREMPNKYFNKN